MGPLDQHRPLPWVADRTKHQLLHETCFGQERRVAVSCEVESVRNPPMGNSALAQSPQCIHLRDPESRQSRRGQIRRSLPGAIQDQELMLEQKRLGNDGTGTVRSEQASQGSDEMDEKDDQIAHHRILAGQEIPTNYGRNNNSPATRRNHLSHTMIPPATGCSPLCYCEAPKRIGLTMVSILAAISSAGTRFGD
jgi:hypothetical protein